MYLINQNLNNALEFEYLPFATRRFAPLTKSNTSFTFIIKNLPLYIYIYNWSINLHFGQIKIVNQYQPTVGITKISTLIYVEIKQFGQCVIKIRYLPNR